MKVLDEAEEEIELRDMDEEDDVVNMERLNKQSEAMKRD
jgi:DNA-directed RNA polymerase subunit beta